MRKRLSAIVAALLIAMTGSAFAQVATTGTITVVIADKDGGRLPGVTVTAEAIDSITKRTAVTDATGTARIRVRVLPNATSQTALLRITDVANGAFLLDVRRSAELTESGFVAGAHNIAHTRLLERVGEIPRTQPVVIHCSSGSRSRYAAGLLDHMGYKVINVTGGFDAWKKMGGAVVMA